MQIKQSLSFQTQHDMAKLFECVIIGMSRLHKCFQYLHSLTFPQKPAFLFNLLTKGQTQALQWQHLTDFLEFHRIKVTRDEAHGLLLIMGGGVEGISKEELTTYLKSRSELDVPSQPQMHTQEMKNEVEMTFVKLLEEELLLERNADQLRLKIEKRWDYQDEALFKAIARGRLNSSIDHVKFKQYFTKLRYPITDEELYYLMKRFGNEGQISFESFQRVVLTLSNRVRNAIDEWSGLRQKSVQNVPQQQRLPTRPVGNYESHFSSKNVRYFERLKKKYLQNTFAQQLQELNKPKRAQSSHQSSKCSENKKGRSTSVSIKNPHPHEVLSKSAIFQKNISLKDVTQQLQLKDAYKTPQKQSMNSLAQDYETVKAKRDIEAKPTNFIRVTEKKASIQDTFKQLNSLTFPLFPLIKAIVRDIEQNHKFFKSVPDGVLMQLRQLRNITDWNNQWKSIGIQNYGITQQALMNVLDKYTKQASQTYETISFLGKLDKQTITFAQGMFELMENSDQAVRQAKLSFFTNKPCSFIQLFEELDKGSKGYLDTEDISNLLKNANVLNDDPIVFNILFKSLNHGDPTERIQFNNFLKELTP